MHGCVATALQEFSPLLCTVGNFRGSELPDVVLADATHVLLLETQASGTLQYVHKQSVMGRAVALETLATRPEISSAGLANEVIYDGKSSRLQEDLQVSLPMHEHMLTMQGLSDKLLLLSDCGRIGILRFDASLCRQESCASAHQLVPSP